LIDVCKTLIPRDIGGAALALAIGAVGSVIFVLLNLPLPWMLGAMFACLLASMAKVPVRRPGMLLPLTRVVLGILVGAAFTPDVLAILPDLAFSLALIPPYIVLVGLIGVPYFRKFAGYDSVTAYFAAMPGGLPDMVVIGKEMGADEARLALVHTVRVLVIVSTLPFIIGRFETVDLGAAARFGIPIADVDPVEQVLLFAAGLIGWRIAARLRLTGASIVGPMIVSAAIHLAGLSDARPPDEVIKAAQLILGVGIGCAFVGAKGGEILRDIVLTLGLMGVMMSVTAMVAASISALTDIAFVSVFIAYTPGGQAEMNLIALSRGEDIVYVAVHHLFRVSLIVIGAPLVIRWCLRPKNRAK
jgi:membrane AbrB-like protein